MLPNQQWINVRELKSLKWHHGWCIYSFILFQGEFVNNVCVSYMWMRHEVGDWYGLCTSSSQTEHVHVFWGYYIGESPDRRDRTFSVGYFQNLATLAGFSNIAYQSFNSVTTKPLIYKCTFSIRYSSIFFSIYDRLTKFISTPVV